MSYDDFLLIVNTLTFSALAFSACVLFRVIKQDRKISKRVEQMITEGNAILNRKGDL